MISLSSKFVHQYKRLFNMQAISLSTSTITIPVKKEPFKFSALAAPFIPQENVLEEQDPKKIRMQNVVRFNNYLSSLPPLEYPTFYKIEYIKDPKEANKRVTEIIETETTFGVDLEWQPCFTKGKSENKVSLVQICSSKEILLIHISHMKFVPVELRKFFENKYIYKTGVNINADGLKLYRDFGFLTNGLIELKQMANKVKSPKLELSHLRSLRALTGMILDQNITKDKVRLSNWSTAELTASQKKYAALDAYASYKLFVVLKELQPDVVLPIKHLEESKPIKKRNTPVLNGIENHKPPFISQYNNKLSPTSTTTIIKAKNVNN